MWMHPDIVIVFYTIPFLFSFYVLPISRIANFFFLENQGFVIHTNLFFGRKPRE